MVRTKICGITRVEDAMVAATLGADAIGLVFYQPSPRSVSIPVAQRIVASLPPFITSVGLFVDAEPAFVHSVLDQVPLDLLQFHGNESEAECNRYSRPYLKALKMHHGIDLVQQCQTFKSSRGILLDTFVAGQAGGTGITFDWSQIPSKLEKHIVLAGGLTASNVADAIKQVRPWGVDVSGGVESSKGKKDPALIDAFLKGVHGVSNQ